MEVRGGSHRGLVLQGQPPGGKNHEGMLKETVSQHDASCLPGCAGPRACGLLRSHTKSSGSFREVHSNHPASETDPLIPAHLTACAVQAGLCDK